MSDSEEVELAALRGPDDGNDAGDAASDVGSLLSADIAYVSAMVGSGSASPSVADTDDSDDDDGGEGFDLEDCVAVSGKDDDVDVPDELECTDWTNHGPPQASHGQSLDRHRPPRPKLIFRQNNVRIWSAGQLLHVSSKQTS